MQETEEVMLGGGCFWCIEAGLAALRGVLAVQSGYAGGTLRAPSYEQVCSGTTGHAEVVHVRFNPQRLPYLTLLDVFFHLHDPTTLNRQGHDVGTQYRSVVFCATPEQRASTQRAIAAWQAQGRFGAPVVTEVADWPPFWPAEPEHQRYYQGHAAQPYCRIVIAPKLASLREHYAPLLASAWEG